MKIKNSYSIGEMSEICNISKKTLRYYDSIGLIPSQRQDFNNYRYYTHDTLLIIPVLKYYKQMGFSLSEMSELLYKNLPNAYARTKECFQTKMKELEVEQEEIRRKNIAIQDWYKLISEAEMVINNDIQQISVKYLPAQTLLFQDQESIANSKNDIINIEWTNYLETIGNAITGPVIITYKSIDDRVSFKENQNIRIMQEGIISAKVEEEFIFGNSLFVSCYHIGSHANLPETYNRIFQWAKQNKYKLDSETHERYVVDYWTSCNDAKFVTEVLIKISRDSSYNF